MSEGQSSHQADTMSLEESTPVNLTWSEQFTQTLAEVRAQSREFLDHQRADLDRIEAELRECLQDFRHQEGDERSDPLLDESYRLRMDQLERRAADLLQLRAELMAQQEAWRAMREAALADQAKHAELLAQREMELAESVLASENSAHRDPPAREELQTLQEQLDEANHRCTQLLAEVAKLRDPSHREAGEDDESPLQEELEDLRKERKLLIDRLAEAESRLSEATSDSHHAQQLEELQQRFQLAVEDARELKRQKAELEEENEQLRHRGTSPADQPLNTDWESQKQRLLSALEGGHEEEGQTRATIEGTVRITDEIIAEKEREISDLKRLLHQHEAAAGDAPGPAADSQAEAVPQNDAARQELATLKRLREEFREKQRQAEIDLAIERAKLAREKSELEEKLQDYQRAAGNLQENNQSDRPIRGRWLTRLGLKESSD